jgi:hypothetical protein
VLENLLALGFLPTELPPLFSSTSLALLKGAALPSELTGEKPPWTQPVPHNLARPGGLRRRLSVPNPGSYFRLAREFEAGRNDLMAAWAASPFSHTKPNPTGATGRAIAPNSSDRSQPRARARVGARYVLRADVSQFYPSIYTHSIPWVLHTKAKAKTSTRDLSLLGNRLDRELQGCHYGQTKGISIGPDTSLGIAELLLADVDRKLDSECRIKGGTRFIDDIELTFERLSDAETALASLERLLAEIELQLNAAKTRIVALPDKIESVYVSELRRHLPAANDASVSSWIDYFNRAFELASQHPQDGVLRYATAALQGVTATTKAWPLAQSLLWQCIATDPGTLRFVVDALLLNKYRAALTPDSSLGTEAINALIRSSALVGHGSEVVWSIWAAIVLHLTLTPESQTAIASVDDSFVAVAAMFAAKRTVFDPAFEPKLWGSWFTEECFVEDHWLFVYEAARRGWFTKEVAAAKFSSAPVPATLLRLGVTFLDDRIADTYVPARLAWTSGASSGGY